MKPCRKNRKPIVLLALSALHGTEAANLKAHLQGCEACRLYFEEISKVKQELSVMASITEQPTAGPFHNRILAGLRATKTTTIWPTGLANHFQAAFNWRIAVPVVCAIAIAMLFTRSLNHPDAQPPAPGQVDFTPASKSYTDLPPTIGSYRALANQSLDELDELLTKQAQKPIPAPLAFRAATLALVNIGD